MFADFFKALVLAYLAPQASARAILSTGAGFGGAMLLLVLGYLLTSVVVILTPGIDRPDAASTVSHHVFSMVMTLFSFFFFATLIYFFGKVSGGTGTREQTYLILAWHSVVTAILSPPATLFWSGFEFEKRANGATSVVGMPGGTTIALGVAAMAISLWLLAHFVTVLHGFRNFWGVAAVIFGIPIGLGFLLMNVLATLSTLPNQGLPQ